MTVAGYILQGMVLGISAAATPGPFQAYLISQSLRLGWKRALPVAFAPLLSDGPIILVVLLALANLPAGLLRFLQIGGGVFVIYLAWKSLKAFMIYQTELPAPDGESKTLMQAVLVNLLNPNPYIFWTVVAGPLLISGWKANPVNAPAFLIGMYGVMIIILALLIGLFASAGKLGPRVTRALLGVSALALLAFGVYQLWQGIFVGVSYM